MSAIERNHDGRLNRGWKIAADFDGYVRHLPSETEWLSVEADSREWRVFRLTTPDGKVPQGSWYSSELSREDVAFGHADGLDDAIARTEAWLKAKEGR